MPPPPPTRNFFSTALPPPRRDRSTAQLLIGAMTCYLGLLMVMGQIVLHRINRNESLYRNGTSKFFNATWLPHRVDLSSIPGEIYISADGRVYRMNDSTSVARRRLAKLICTASTSTIIRIGRITTQLTSPQHEPTTLRRPGEDRART